MEEREKLIKEAVDKVRQDISQSKYIFSSLENLRSLLLDHPESNEVIYLNSIFNRNEKNFFNSIISHEDFSISTNKATLAVLKLLDQIEIDHIKTHNQSKSQTVKIFGSKNIYIEKFTGRSKDLSDFEKFIIKSKSSIINIYGIGGIGKSSFVKKYAINSGARNILFFESADDLSNEVLSNRSLINHFSFKPKENRSKFDVCVDFFRHISRYSDGFNLIIFDKEFSQVDKYINYLPSDENWMVIIVTRGKINNLENFELRPVAVSDAVDIFKLYNSTFSNNSILEEIAELAYFHPLAIEMLSKHGEYLDLTEMELLSFLKFGDSIYDDDDSLIFHKSSGHYVSAKSLIASAFKLPENILELHLLLCFAVLPGNTTYDRKIIFYLLQFDRIKEEKSFNLALFNLLRRGWINKTGFQYSFHPLLKEVVLSKDLTSITLVRERLFESISNYLESKSFKNENSNNFSDSWYSRFIVALSSIIAKVESQNINHEIIGLNSLYRFYNHLGYLGFSGRYISEASQKIRLEGVEERVSMLTELNTISIHIQGYRYKEASEIIKSLTIEKVSEFFSIERVWNFVTWKGVCYYNGERDLVKAEKEFLTALKLIDESYEDEASIVGKMTIMANLAHIYENLGDSQKAIVTIDNALSFGESLLSDKSPSLAQVYYSAAGIKYPIDPKIALSYLEKGFEIVDKAFPITHPLILKYVNFMADIYGETENVSMCYGLAMDILNRDIYRYLLYPDQVKYEGVEYRFDDLVVHPDYANDQGLIRGLKYSGVKQQFPYIIDGFIRLLSTAATGAVILNRTDAARSLGETLLSYCYIEFDKYSITIAECLFGLSIVEGKVGNVHDQLIYTLRMKYIYENVLNDTSDYRFEIANQVLNNIQFK